MWPSRIALGLVALLRRMPGVRAAAEGLDSPNHLEMPAKISLYAHRIFDPIYGNHEPHLASLEIRRPQFDWFAVRGAGEGGICGTMRVDERNRA
jgi:hypothetical protein